MFDGSRLTIRRIRKTIIHVYEKKSIEKISLQIFCLQIISLIRSDDPWWRILEPLVDVVGLAMVIVK
jgi:hypothetical protein